MSGDTVGEQVPRNLSSTDYVLVRPRVGSFCVEECLRRAPTERYVESSDVQRGGRPRSPDPAAERVTSEPR